MSVKEIVEALKRGFWLVNANLGIFALALAIHFMPRLEQPTGFGWLRLIDWAMILIGLGWLGAEIRLLRDASQKRIIWKSLPDYIWKYIKRLFLPALILGLIFGGVLVGMYVTAGKWYMAEFPEKMAGLDQKAQIEQVVIGLGRGGGFISFFEQMQLGVLGYAIEVAWILMVPLIVTSLVVLVADDLSVTETVGRAIGFLRKRWLFYVFLVVGMWVLGRIIGALMFLRVGVLPWVSFKEQIGVMSEVVESPWNYLFRVIGIYKTLVVNAFVLVYYLRFFGGRDKKRGEVVFQR